MGPRPRDLAPGHGLEEESPDGCDPDVMGGVGRQPRDLRGRGGVGTGVVDDTGVVVLLGAALPLDGVRRDDDAGRRVPRHVELVRRAHDRGDAQVRDLGQRLRLRRKRGERTDGQEERRPGESASGSAPGSGEDRKGEAGGVPAAHRLGRTAQGRLRRPVPPCGRKAAGDERQRRRHPAERAHDGRRHGGACPAPGRRGPGGHSHGAPTSAR